MGLDVAEKGCALMLQEREAGSNARSPVQVDPQTLKAEESYKLITGIVVPRPVAWVTTLSPSGSVNLAPFSAFTFVSPKPPMLAISVGHKAGPTRTRPATFSRARSSSSTSPIGI